MDQPPLGVDEHAYLLMRMDEDHRWSPYPLRLLLGINLVSHSTFFPNTTTTY
jgi:hypothetical protein